MDFRAILAGLVCTVALAAPARAQGTWPAACKLVPAASLPFHLAGGQPVIDVQANGTPRQFGINTGGVASSINENVADALHLQQFGIHPNVRITDAGGAEATHYALLGNLVIGNLDAKDIRLMVRPENGLDGVIAPDLLRNFDVEIDFPNRTINFFQPHPCAGKAVYWTDKFSAVSIDVTRQGHIRLPVELNGRGLYAMLGTGNAISDMTASVADARFGIKPQGPERTVHGGLGGELAVSEAPFDSLKIGDTTLQKPLIGLTSARQVSFFDKAAQESDLTLGLREMSRFHIYIAYRERKLYLSEENSAPSAAITVTARTMAPAEAIAAAKRAAPAPFAGTFAFQVQSAGRSNDQLFLNSEADFHDPANLSVVVPLAEAAKLAEGGAAPEDTLKGKHITVVGGARVVRVRQLQGGQPMGQPQIQIRIPVTSASQVSIVP